MASTGAAIDFFGNELPVTPGSDIIYTAKTGVEDLTGTAANEVFVADGGNDVMNGGGGSDQFADVSSNDTITQKPGGVSTAYQSGDVFQLPTNVQNLTVWSGSVSYGNSMANIIHGANGELIDGGAGNDVLSGGTADTFQFAAGSGYDVIRNFVPGSGSGADAVRLSGYAQFQSFAQVQAAMTQVGSDVVLRLVD